MDYHGDFGIDRFGEFEDPLSMVLAVTGKLNSTEHGVYDAVIVGLGKTGLSCAKYLAHQGMKIALTDNRKQPPALADLQRLLPDVSVFLGRFDIDLLRQAKQVFISPGVPLQEPDIQQVINFGTRVSGDVELFAQAVRDVPIIAITGSNGKSTVTELVAQIFLQAGWSVLVGGNIGTPVLDLLANQPPDIYILELSSFQLETTYSLNADAATILNISPDHMDRYTDLTDYITAKQRIYHGNGLMVINLDDPYIGKLRLANRNFCGFTLEGRGKRDKSDIGLRQFSQGRYLCRGNLRLIAETELGMSGAHNTANALAAMALVSPFSLPDEAIYQALKTFNGLPHRCQQVSNFRDVGWYNDSKGTNVGACCAAIKSLAKGQNIILIAGGQAKEGNFSDLVSIARGRLKAVIVMGVDGTLIAKALEEVSPIYDACDMADAVRQANGLADNGDVVLLSPACASFDMYRDYAERGELFMQTVQSLKGQS